MNKEIGIGIIGYSGIGKLHTYSYMSIPLFYDMKGYRIKLKGVCNRSESTCLQAMNEAPFEFYTTDYKELLDRDDIHVINVCTPNSSHYPLIIDALKARKHVFVEKPLALTVQEAKEIVELAQQTGLKNQLAFQYRFIPATIKAKKLIESGALGEIYHFSGSYLHSGYEDPARPLTWRLQHKYSGGGALMDLGSHIIDLLLYLIGDFKSVSASKATFIHERPLPSQPGLKGPVDVDDYCRLNVKTNSGAIGSIEASRFAVGTTDDLKFEIFGSKGSIKFSMMDPNFLYYFDATSKEKGYTKIQTVHKYEESKSFPPPKSPVGWTRFSIANQFHFIDSIINNKTNAPNFKDGLEVQKVMHYAYQSCDNSGKWINIE
ncbi:MAG: putative dehydrogenase [Clostridia bacterium]|jgi:predicted dehydrogenase|nr:putative dehydrogenase [Clostridia bacterium]